MFYPFFLYKTKLTKSYSLKNSILTLIYNNLHWKSCLNGMCELRNAWTLNIGHDNHYCYECIWQIVNLPHVGRCVIIFIFANVTGNCDPIHILSLRKKLWTNSSFYNHCWTQNFISLIRFRKRQPRNSCSLSGKTNTTSWFTLP